MERKHTEPEAKENWKNSSVSLVGNFSESQFPYL